MPILLAWDITLGGLAYYDHMSKTVSIWFGQADTIGLTLNHQGLEN